MAGQQGSKQSGLSVPDAVGQCLLTKKALPASRHGAQPGLSQATTSAVCLCPVCLRVLHDHHGPDQGQQPTASRPQNHPVFPKRIKPHRPAREQVVWAERAGGPWPEASPRLQELSAMSSTNRSAVGLRAASSPPNTNILLPILVACTSPTFQSCAPAHCCAVCRLETPLSTQSSLPPTSEDLAAGLGGMHREKQPTKDCSSSAWRKHKAGMHAHTSIAAGTTCHSHAPRPQACHIRHCKVCRAPALLLHLSWS